MPCEICVRRSDKRYKDRDALCRHYSLQGMERVQRLGMCPFTLHFDTSKKKARVGQQKSSWGSK